MKFTKLGTDYKITEKGTNGKTLKMTVYYDKDGVTLFTDKSQTDFTFIDSDPELVMKIGEMIYEAGRKYNGIR